MQGVEQKASQQRPQDPDHGVADQTARFFAFLVAAQQRSRCRSGQRAYYATRILLQNGFKAKNVSGGMLSLAHNGLLEWNDSA